MDDKKINVCVANFVDLYNTLLKKFGENDADYNYNLLVIFLTMTNKYTIINTKNINEYYTTH